MVIPPNRNDFTTAAVYEQPQLAEPAIYTGGGLIALIFITSCWLYQKGRCCCAAPRGAKGAERTSIDRDDVEKNRSSTLEADTTRAVLRDDQEEAARIEDAKRTGRPSPDTEAKLKHAEASH